MKLGLGLGLNNGVASAGGGGVPAWDISSGSFSQSAAVSGSAPADLVFNPDGTRMFMLDNSTDTVYEYTLSTPWDLTTLSATGTTFSTTTQENNPRGIDFNDDGTAMFIVGLGSDAIFQYTLPTPYTLSGASYASKTTSIITNCAINLGGKFTLDGEHFYAIDLGIGIVEYDVGTAFDASTLTYSGNSLATAGVDSTPYAVLVHPNGTQMLLMGQSGDSIYQYTLSTPYDVTTATYDSVSFSTFSEDTSMTGMYITPDGDAIFTVGTQNDDVYKYTL